ncbi:hypothetical protein HN958_01830 [Candidatus Falkowbacteria bacterium]|jgi:hypothetical protein|nr:hypothetical protein [Candidatus Falkowbacteria bacterium]
MDNFQRNLRNHNALGSVAQFTNSANNGLFPAWMLKFMSKHIYEVMLGTGLAPANALLNQIDVKKHPDQFIMGLLYLFEATGQREYLIEACEQVIEIFGEFQSFNTDQRLTPLLREATIKCAILTLKNPDKIQEGFLFSNFSSTLKSVGEESLLTIIRVHYYYLTGNDQTAREIIAEITFRERPIHKFDKQKILRAYCNVVAFEYEGDHQFFHAAWDELQKIHQRLKTPAAKAAFHPLIQKLGIGCLDELNIRLLKKMSEIAGAQTALQFWGKRWEEVDRFSPNYEFQYLIMIYQLRQKQRINQQTARESWLATKELARCMENAKQCALMLDWLYFAESGDFSVLGENSDITNDAHLFMPIEIFEKVLARCVTDKGKRTARLPLFHHVKEIFQLNLTRLELIQLLMVLYKNYV